MNYHDELRRAIEAMHGSDSLWVESVPIKEVFHGKTVWQGVVEVFSLTDHPKAKRCYAWGARDDKGALNITTVLELPPVISPQTAVKVAVAAHVRKETSQRSGKS